MKFILSWIIVLGSIVVSCENRPSATRIKDDPFLQAPDHLSFDIEVVFTDSTFTKAVLHAGEAQVFDGRQQTTLGRSVQVDFYSRSGASSARLTSDSAIIEDRTHNMTAIGNVMIRSDSSRTTLATQRLIWINSTQRVRSDEAVRIITPTETIDGIGFESDQYLTSYRIFQVTGVHRP